MYLGANVNDPHLTYADFEVPQEFANISISAVSQKQWLNRLRTGLAPTRYPVGVLGIHSTPTDYSAMSVGAAIFEQAAHKGLVVRCLSLTDIVTMDKHRPLEADLFMIHTLTEQVIKDYVWPLRDFLRSRSTSMRILIMASDVVGDGARMQRDILRIRDISAMICLRDSDRSPNLRLT